MYLFLANTRLRRLGHFGARPWPLFIPTKYFPSCFPSARSFRERKARAGQKKNEVTLVIFYLFCVCDDDECFCYLPWIDGDGAEMMVVRNCGLVEGGCGAG
jgi:hypothetical protein